MNSQSQARLFNTASSEIFRAKLLRSLFSSVFIICLLFILGCISQVFPATKSVYAEDNSLGSINHRKLNDAERGNLSTGCASVQASLKNLQKSDSKTRVLLGTSYQTLLTNYISPLNIRLIKNNLPDSILTEIQSDILSSRNTFINLFITYSQHLESLIAMDCKNQPDDFYFELENVRFLRNKLEISVTKVNDAITSHLKATDQLKATLPTNSASDKNSDKTTNEAQHD